MMAFTQSSHDRIAAGRDEKGEKKNFKKIGELKSEHRVCPYPVHTPAPWPGDTAARVIVTASYARGGRAAAG